MINLQTLLLNSRSYFLRLDPKCQVGCIIYLNVRKFYDQKSRDQNEFLFVSFPSLPSQQKLIEFATLPNDRLKGNWFGRQVIINKWRLRLNAIMESISKINFRVVWIGYSEIKHFDWMLQVTWRISTNQSALFGASRVLFCSIIKHYDWMLNVIRLVSASHTALFRTRILWHLFNTSAPVIVIKIAFVTI